MDGTVTKKYKKKPEIGARKSVAKITQKHKVKPICSLLCVLFGRFSLAARRNLQGTHKNAHPLAAVVVVVVVGVVNLIIRVTAKMAVKERVCAHRRRERGLVSPRY